MRILYVTTVGGTMSFFIDLIRMLSGGAVQVDIACNDRESRVPEAYTRMGCRIQRIDCSRSPFSRGNLRAISQIRKVVVDGRYDIVHCHTPIAAACTRIACRRFRRHGVKVVYTAHGFHFYKGASLKNWLLYFPVEWICSWMTDVLICITKEDYERALKYLHARKTEYVPGVGVDLSRFEAVDGSGVREELGLGPTDTILLSVGELNANKNHQVVVRTLPNLPDDVHYVIAGQGDQRDALLGLADGLDVSRRLHLLGFRDDVPRLMAAADIYVLPSLREGLNVSLMEAMASGLPCTCGRIRGNVDLISDDDALFDPRQPDEVRSALWHFLSCSSDERAIVSNGNRETVAAFGLNVINEKMLSEIYAINR